MKIYLVWYINSSYEDHIVDIFLSKYKADKYIDTHVPDYDKVNYYVEEWKVNE